MSPDEYDAIIAELDKESEQANEVFEAETEPGYLQLEEARQKYYKEVYDPANLRWEEKEYKIEAKRKDAFREMWETHLQGEKDLQAFVLDLISNPYEIEEKLQAKIRENNESS